MGNSSIPYAPSTDWGIMTSLGGGAGGGITVNVMLFYLLNVRAQVIYPGRFISVGVGGGAGIRGASMPNASWTFFRTSTPLRTEDFAGFATIASGEITVGPAGGSIGYVTFWGVDHDPYWIDIGGVTFGLSGGAGVSLLCSVHFFNDPRRVVGTVIAP